MTLSTCLNCQLYADRHCAKNPTYFGVHEIIKTAFTGDTRQAVEAKVEACPYWAISATKAVTAQVTMTLQQWDGLLDLETVPEPPAGLKCILGMAHTALDPEASAEGMITYVCPPPDTSTDETEDATSEASEASEVPETPVDSAEPVTDVDVQEEPATEPEPPTQPELTGEVDAAPPANDAEASGEVAPEPPASNAEAPEAADPESPAESTPAADQPPSEGDLSEIDLTVTVDAPVLETIYEEVSSRIPALNSQEGLSKEHIEQTIHAVIEEFWKSASLQQAGATPDPSAEMWRGSGRIQSPDQLGFR